MAFGVASIIAALIAPGLVHRFSNRVVLMFSSASLILYPMIMAVSYSPYPLVVAELAAGIAFALLNITLFNRLIEVVPASRRGSYVGLYNAVLNLALFGAPLLTTTVLEPMGIRTIFFLAGGLRIVGGLLFGMSRGVANEDQGSTATEDTGETEQSDHTALNRRATAEAVSGSQWALQHIWEDLPKCAPRT